MSEESTNGLKEMLLTIKSNPLSSGTFSEIFSKSNGISELVSGSFTIPIVPPV
jgi:hypothetical protein